MRKLFYTVVILGLATPAIAAQTEVTNITGVQSSVGALKDSVNTKLGVIESNRTDHESRVAALEADKSDKAAVIRYWSDWPDASPGNTLAAGTVVAYEGELYKATQEFVKTEGATPTAFTSYFTKITSVGGGDYTLPTASVETLGGIKVGDRLSIDADGVLSADVQTTDISGKEDSLGNPSTNGYVLSSTTDGVRSWIEMTGGGTGIAHATADGNYYASKDGGWVSLTGLYAPALGADDNYVTDAEKIKLASIAEGAEVNVNADWNSSSGDSQILNKPIIPTVSTAAYNTSTWDASTSAPDQNALRDYLINFDSDGDGDFTDEAWFPAGSSMVYPGAGIPVSTGSAWGTSYSLVTTVSTTGVDTNIPSEQAVREALDLKANVENIAFLAGVLSDIKIKTTAQPTNGEPLIDDTVTYGATDDNLRLWSIDKVGSELAGKAASDHSHTGTYEPADATILKDGDIGSTVQAYDADLDDDAIEFVIDGGGSAITTGTKGFLEVPYNATINRTTIVCDQSGSIAIDVWKDSYANYPPTDADSITASAVPTVSTATKAQDTTLTGWTTSLSAGDFIGFNVDSASTVTNCTISLKVTK